MGISRGFRRDVRDVVLETLVYPGSEGAFGVDRVVEEAGSMERVDEAKNSGECHDEQCESGSGRATEKTIALQLVFVQRCK